MLDLLLTDVIMPGMTGPKVAEELLKLRPDIRVLFMSGYSDEELARYDGSAGPLHLIQKPFALTVLMREIRALLDAPVESAAPSLRTIA
jgi:two-component system, cell cycle sensor histidine kinase and response regulator CckA